MYVLKAIWVLTVCAPIKSGSTPEQKNKLKKKKGGIPENNYHFLLGWGGKHPTSLKFFIIQAEYSWILDYLDRKKNL